MFASISNTLPKRPKGRSPTAEELKRLSSGRNVLPVKRLRSSSPSGSIYTAFKYYGVCAGIDSYSEQGNVAFVKASTQAAIFHAPRQNTCPSLRNRQARSLLQRRFSGTTFRAGGETHGEGREERPKDPKDQRVRPPSYTTAEEKNTRQAFLACSGNEDILLQSQRGRSRTPPQMTPAALMLIHSDPSPLYSGSPPTATKSFSQHQDMPLCPFASSVTCIMTGNLSRSIAMLAPREGFPPLSLLAVITIFAPGASSTLESSLGGGRWRRWWWWAKKSKGIYRKANLLGTPSQEHPSPIAVHIIVTHPVDVGFGRKVAPKKELREEPASANCSFLFSATEREALVRSSMMAPRRIVCLPATLRQPF